MNFLIPDKKITDDEIEKAFEYCNENEDCSGCPCYHKCPSSYEVLKQILDINKRQKDEINKLTELKAEVSADKAMLQVNLKYAKAEAYKEFAERLKEKRWDVPYETKDAHFVQVVDVGDIDNLLKELVGEDDE